MPDGTLPRQRQDRLAIAIAKYDGPRRDAAARALNLIAELESTCGELDASSTALRQAGGHHVDLRAHQSLFVLKARLRAIGGA